MENETEKPTTSAKPKARHPYVVSGSRAIPNIR